MGLHFRKVFDELGENVSTEAVSMVESEDLLSDAKRSFKDGFHDISIQQVMKAIETLLNEVADCKSSDCGFRAKVTSLHLPTDLQQDLFSIYSEYNHTLLAHTPTTQQSSSFCIEAADRFQKHLNERLVNPCLRIHWKGFSVEQLKAVISVLSELDPEEMREDHDELGFCEGPQDLRNMQLAAKEELESRE